ncbi:MAG: protease modulator HflK, partial [Novosphingobium sp.]
MKAIRDAVARRTLAMAGRRSPWGGGNQEGPEGSGPDGDPGSRPEGPAEPRGPRNPWLPSGNEAPPRRSASIDDIFRKGSGPRGPGGGGGGGFPGMPRRPDGKSWTPLIVGGIVALWLVTTTGHLIGPKEQGIVTTFGKYS